MSTSLPTSLRSYLFAAAILAPALLPAFCTAASADGGNNDPRRATPDAALAALKAGNKRFASAQGNEDSNHMQRVEATAAHQYPIASVFTCADSRTPPETIFDLGIGDLFVCRVAGVVPCVNDQASFEYGTAVLGSPLIVVMGHTNCGAMKAAIADKPLPGSLPRLVAQIRPAVRLAEAEDPKADAATLLAEATRQQVLSVMRHLMKSPVLREAVAAGKLKIVGAIYDIQTGKVTWL